MLFRLNFMADILIQSVDCEAVRAHLNLGCGHTSRFKTRPIAIKVILETSQLYKIVNLATNKVRLCRSNNPLDTH